MDIQSMINVLKAYKEGKAIECKGRHRKTWVQIDVPVWDFVSFDYRIKPEPNCRPFESAEEVMEAIRKHGDWVKDECGLYRQITGIGRYIDDTYCGIKVNSKDWLTLEEAMRDYTFLDGTPFGKLEE